MNRMKKIDSKIPGVLPTPEELEEMSNVDVREVDSDSLVDIRDVHIDPALPVKERVLDYVRQIRNPYCYRCGNTVVKISFAGKKTLEDCLADAMET